MDYKDPYKDHIDELVDTTPVPVTEDDLFLSDEERIFIESNAAKVNYLLNEFLSAKGPIAMGNAISALGVFHFRLGRGFWHCTRDVGE